MQRFGLFLESLFVKLFQTESTPLSTDSPVARLLAFISEAHDGQAETIAMK